MSTAIIFMFNICQLFCKHLNASAYLCVASQALNGVELPANLGLTSRIMIAQHLVKKSMALVYM